VRKASQRKSLLTAVKAEGFLRDGPASPEDDFASLELSKAIDVLPRRYREVFVLREVEGLSLSETAHLLEIRSGTVKSRASRARGLLRSLLGPEFDIRPSKTMVFAGQNCDRLVADVLGRISQLSS
jgi:RNA polymerase sigma-70 factor (ECF subfamily)